MVRQYNSFKFKQLPGSQSFYILAEERTSQYIIEGKHKAVFRRSTMASSMDIDSESQGSIKITTDRDQYNFLRIRRFVGWFQMEVSDMIR